MAAWPTGRPRCKRRVPRAGPALKILRRFVSARSNCAQIVRACAVLLSHDMRGAKRYEDLIVWQLADQIRVLVFQLTSRESFTRDLKLHSQTEDAVNSMCRNIAEGFSCGHKEFARFLQISRRSLDELRDSFRAAQLKRYVTAHEYEPIWRLAHRLYPAYAELSHHLRTTPDPDQPPSRRKPRPSRTDSKPTRTNRDRVRTDQKPPGTDRDPARTDQDPARTNRNPPRTDGNPARTDPAERVRTDPRR
jgi:four helix bundle protein